MVLMFVQLRSSQKFTQGLSWRVLFQKKVPTDLLAAHDKLIASRKLSRTLRSKSISEETVCARDKVQVFVKK